MEAINNKILPKLIPDFSKTPTLGEECEGDVLNVPCEKGNNVKKRENRETKLSTSKRSKRTALDQQIMKITGGIKYFGQGFNHDGRTCLYQHC